MDLLTISSRLRKNLDRWHTPSIRKEEVKGPPPPPTKMLKFEAIKCTFQCILSNHEEVVFQKRRNLSKLQEKYFTSAEVTVYQRKTTFLFVFMDLHRQTLFFFLSFVWILGLTFLADFYCRTQVTGDRSQVTY